VSGAEKPKSKPAQAPRPVVERDDVIVSACRCPFCHTDITLREEAWVSCQGCLARHHAACWKEGKACASCGEGEHLVAGTRHLPAIFHRVLVYALLAAMALALVPLYRLNHRLTDVKSDGEQVRESLLRKAVELDRAQREVERLDALRQELEQDTGGLTGRERLGQRELNKKLQAARAQELQARHRAASVEAQRARLERERDALEERLRELEGGSD